MKKRCFILNCVNKKLHKTIELYVPSTTISTANTHIYAYINNKNISMCTVQPNGMNM